MIIEDRLTPDITLAAGAHEPGDAMCLLEAAAWIAGEPWTDRPECVCPVLAAFGRSWNDALPDDDRDRILLPFLPRLIGTRSTADVQDKRAFMATDWAVRVFTPAWLRKAGLDDDAAALEALPELSSVELCNAAMPAIRKAQRDAAGDAARYAARYAARDAAGYAARDAVWYAARYAARDAARDAVWYAAGDAAGDAARYAAGYAARDAAGYAARDAARDAARYAAGDAARAAAWAALADTVTELQQSAADLLSRMIAVSS